MPRRTIRHTIGRLHRGQEGQMLWMAAALLAVFGGIAAMAVDLGSWIAERRDLQNAADAIALAASLELPDGEAAQDAADEWAVKNGIDPEDVTVEIIPQNLPTEPNPKVRVRIERDHDFTFARLVGISSAEVEGQASAIKTSPAGGDGLIPLSITEAAVNGASLGQPLVLKYDANDITEGNTGPIRIDGPGTGHCTSSDRYCAGLQFGSENTVCAAGASTTYCSGPSVVDTEPGNKIGATRDAIEYRINSTATQCDAFSEVFEDDPLSSDPGDYRLQQECNPFVAGSYASDRVLIVPVINQLCNGSCSVTIVSFALMFLEGFGNDGCTGNDCEVVGRFVRVNQNVGLLAGTYDPDSANHFVRLVN